MRTFVYRALLLGFALGPAVPVCVPLDQDQSQPVPSAIPPMPPPSGGVAPSLSAAAAPDPLREAKALARKGDFQAAIEAFQQLLKYKPNSSDAYAGLATGRHSSVSSWIRSICEATDCQ